MTTRNVEECLEILKKVQEIDHEIYAIRRDLTVIPESIQQLTLGLEAEKSHLMSLEARQKEIQLRQRQKESELAEKEALIKKYDAQLAQVKTNKEYSSLQKEIDSLKADRSIVEDAILALLDEIDRLQNQVREERARLAEVEKETETQKKSFLDQMEKLKQDLSGLGQKRAGVISEVPAESRELYEKIVEKKEGIALTPLIGEACGACRIDIRPQLLNELHLKENFVICENCSRILYTK